MTRVIIKTFKVPANLTLTPFTMATHGLTKPLPLHDAGHHRSFRERLVGRIFKASSYHSQAIEIVRDARQNMTTGLNTLWENRDHMPENEAANLSDDHLTYGLARFDSIR